QDGRAGEVGNSLHAGDHVAGLILLTNVRGRFGEVADSFELLAEVMAGLVRIQDPAQGGVSVVVLVGRDINDSTDDLGLSQIATSAASGRGVLDLRDECQSGYRVT